MTQICNVLRIAIPSPLLRSFDYLPPANLDLTRVQRGVRVLVPFGPREMVGVLLEVSNSTEVPLNKLKPVLAVLDPQPLLPETIFQLVLWASDYYHYSLGEVFTNVWPALLRIKNILGPELLFSKRSTSNKTIPTTHFNEAKPQALSTAQNEALAQVLQNLTVNKNFLLEGVTGSGKTEVYLRIIESIIASGKQALVLIPEINLTPQTVARFHYRFPEVDIVAFHSRLNDRERLRAWFAAREGEAKIVIGTRSAIFTPLKNPGIIILDEEHDLSFKQQSGFRYHTRVLALQRAKLENIPVILGSATPALESLQAAKNNFYQHLILPERVGVAILPKFQLVDMRRTKIKGGLAWPIWNVMQEHLANNGQVLIFVNRRGYAPTLLCHQCSWSATCSDCDARLILHQKAKNLQCHHCGKVFTPPPTCPSCGYQDLVACGVGTERVEEYLRKYLPDAKVVRIDSDTTTRKGVLEQMFFAIKNREYQILVGTQMLTKGHHFPDVTMVVIVNADGGLFSADFRAGEYLAQLITQVSGRAGRAEKPGTVYIQTHQPEHPLLQKLIHHGYQGFAATTLAERQEAQLPPFAHLALLRAEDSKQEHALELLQKLRNYGEKIAAGKVKLSGPIPAALERKKKLYQVQLLLHSCESAPLHELLRALVAYSETLSIARRVRWSIDVDPVGVLD